MAVTWGMISVGLAVMLAKSCALLQAVICIVLHLAPLMSMWSLQAVSHMSLISGFLLAVRLRRDATVMSSTNFQRLGCNAATLFTMAKNTTGPTLVP